MSEPEEEELEKEDWLDEVEETEEEIDEDRDYDYDDEDSYG